MLTPISLMEDICNRKTYSLAKSKELDDISLGKYMFNRWLSMTSPKNALVASEVMNSYWFPDDKELMYKVATLFAGRCGRFKYAKKPKEKKPPENKREWGEEISNREKDIYTQFLNDLENAKNDIG